MQCKGQGGVFICFLIMTFNNIYSLFLGKVPGRAHLLLQIIPIGWSYEYETSFYYLVSQKFSDSNIHLNVGMFLQIWNPCQNNFWVKKLSLNALMSKIMNQSSNNLFWRSIHEGSFMGFKGIQHGAYYMYHMWTPWGPYKARMTFLESDHIAS